MRPCWSASERAWTPRRLLAAAALSALATTLAAAPLAAQPPPDPSLLDPPAAPPPQLPAPPWRPTPPEPPQAAAPEEPVPAGAAADPAPAAAAPSAAPAAAPAEPPPPDGPPAGAEVPFAPPYFPVNFSVFYPLGMNAAAPDLWTHLDLSIVLGRVGFVEGVQLGLVTWTAYNLRGAQLSLAGVISGRAEGLQTAGTFAFVDGPFEGVQLSGIFGWASASVRGAQLAGIANQTYGDISGLQLAGFINIARRQVTGLQAAAVNVGRVDGLQIGGINVSQEQRGLQIGVINVARRIDGLQVGVINITDNLDGESLGIIPLPRRGGIHLALWGSTSLYGNAGLKFSSRYAYSILSAAFHSEERPDGAVGRAPVYAGGLTMGARLPVSYEGLSLSSDLGAYRLFRDELSFSGRDELLKLRLVLAYSLARRLSPFVTAGAYMTLRGEDEVDVTAGPDFALGLEL